MEPHVDFGYVLQLDPVDFSRCRSMAKACAQQALLRLTDVELVDLAAKRVEA
jgi:hypothetical protein